MSSDGLLKNRWIKCISSGGTLRGVAIQASDLIQQAIDLHKVEGKVAQGFGETIIGSLLLASFTKLGERINLNVKGTGVIEQCFVDAYSDGTFRGYVLPRPEDLQIQLRADQGPWGDGIISVLRTKETLGEQPYIGTVPMITGHMAKDLTFYWVQSEQIPSAVGIGVQVEGNKVKAAGGFLTQAMPGATQKDVIDIENQITHLPNFLSNLALHPDPMHLLSQIFVNTGFTLLEERKLEFKCNCSEEKVDRVLLMVGVGELQRMIQDEEAFVQCDFCTKKYLISKDKINSVLSKSKTPVD